MGEARQNILVKRTQMQMINHQFQGEQIMDTVKISDFSESLKIEQLFQSNQ